MIGTMDIFILIFLLIITIYVIISYMSSIIDNKLINLKTDIINIKCNKVSNIIDKLAPPDNIEKYGNLPDDVDERENKIMNFIANKSNQSTEDLLQTITNDENISKIENPNFNTLNNLPYLIDPQNPNEGYYHNRVKLITNPDSPLLKKAKDNMKKIDLQLKKSANKNLTNSRNITGFNNYENLSEDSYANITSIGKSLLTPYTSYPLPS